MFVGSVGLRSARGSTSEFGYSTLPADCWTSAWSAVQPRNGLAPGEATTGGAPVAVGASASASAAATNRMKRFMQTSLLRLSACCGFPRPYAGRGRPLKAASDLEGVERHEALLRLGVDVRDYLDVW